MRKFAFNIVASMAVSGILALLILPCLILGDKALFVSFTALCAMFLIQAMIFAQTVNFDSDNSTSSLLSPLPHILNKAWCLWAVSVNAPFDRGPWISLIWVAVIALIGHSMCKNIGHMLFQLTERHTGKKMKRLEDQEREELAQDVKNSLQAELIKSKNQQKIEDDLMADLSSFLSDVELPEDKN